MTSGLVQQREEFILPNDAYPVLENAFVWRERIKRKQGFQLIGRLQRNLSVQALGTTDGSGNFSGNIKTILSLETNASIVPGSVSVSVGAQTFTDSSGNGVLAGGGGGTVNYSTMALTLATAPTLATTAITISFSYYPCLPVMGLLSRELSNINSTQTIAFDTKYAYVFSGTWSEWIPGTTWSGTDYNFFWPANYWVDKSNNKIFWVTNFSGKNGDPIRYTNGSVWIDFAPQIDASSNLLTQCLILIPFRGRLVAFNTLEGQSLSTSINYPQRIRWAAIGTPFTTTSSIVTTVNANAWRDDIRGQGGFLDIPTAQDIVAVGFVRDNLVVYCESSTWQLRYTGRTIAPFQIEKINSELGAESTFSAVQFDTSLVGIGDKGVVRCDSSKSERIDIKIPDLVFSFDQFNNGYSRIYGIRDFVQRLAFWVYPYQPGDGFSTTYPNRRLVYNYENDSWAIFTDSLTCLGNFQPAEAKTWENADTTWQQANFPWVANPPLILQIAGGNQQGYVEQLDQQTTNDVSLYIKNITGKANVGQATVITSPNHNLVEGQIVQISNIPLATPFASLNGGIFFAAVIDANNFGLWLYDPQALQFTLPQLNAPATYIGGGEITIRDNFRVVSKKFNFLDEGQNIQLGYIDLLIESTAAGAITLNVYLDYQDSVPINNFPQNIDPATLQPDTFFNSTVPTISQGGLGGSKNYRHVFCPARGAFLTIEWTLSNAQMIGEEQESNVQIDAQILWLRRAGRLQTSMN